jgi:N-acetylglucosaminyldiphosphoundecaprenol N-acetyl-beta-D-mannosaminyltransferase
LFLDRDSEKHIKNTGMNQLDRSKTEIPIKRVNILGVNISSINMDIALHTIDSWIHTNSHNYVCVTPAHGVMDCVNDPALRRTFNSSGMTTPDGMSIVWLLKLKGYKDVGRVYGPDLMKNVCQYGVKKGYRHFLYGGKAGIPEQLANQLKQKFPGIQIVGTVSPPFRPLTATEDQAIIEQINQSGADIVWVGVSTPKQEIWMSEHLKKIYSPVMIGVGAAFDFLSGNKSQAPRWIQNIGMEWLFRLLNEPTRLWHRYAQYPYFVFLVAMQSLRLIDFSEN